ncbi:MAG: hypothetical protein JWM08_1034 [Candidatus Angelobacter sp.]|nr:hypothetical protein [Candidatus Angelobacter sp.]
MRVMGIEVTGSDTVWAILSCSSKCGTIETSKPPKIPLPVLGSSEIDNLSTLRAQVRDLLISKHIDAVGVIRADPGCSVIRAKIECIVQFAAKEASVTCTLLSIQTVIAAEKRGFAKVAEKSFGDAFGNISPSYLKKSLYCAWSVMNAHE